MTIAILVLAALSVAVSAYSAALARRSAKRQAALRKRLASRQVEVLATPQPSITMTGMLSPQQAADFRKAARIRGARPWE